MCEDPVQADRSMVSSDSHQSQELLVPPQPQPAGPGPEEVPQPASPSSPTAAPGSFDLEKMSKGPVNAITVLTLLDKLVNMLDTVQDNQHKMEVRQVEMEGVVRGIQADMTKLSKSHSHTANTVSKLLDKSRKVSVTMKEVRDKMERQGVQVRKLEANHNHLLNRNNFKVLIFQEENEIPSSVFVKDPPPFPRDELQEGGEESAPGVVDGDRSQEGGLHTIDLSSDEDVGLEAELEDEEVGLHDLENMEKSRAEKLKRSSLKKVDSLKKAFSRQNIEKKMTKIGTKIVSAEQREKIKQKTSSLKVSPLTFSIRKPRSSSASQLSPEAPSGDSPAAEAHIQLSPLGSGEHELSFPEVHAQLAPAEPREGEEHGEREEQEEVQQEEVQFEEVQHEEVQFEEVQQREKEEEKEKEKEEEEEVVAGGEVDLSALSEGISESFALSATLPHQEREEREEELS
ncbi:caveolae-associated protein 2b [Myripristis murdjan]|uniref:Caveolae associated protein 2b n=1 Tax=Myripristis murdjan TaxID=586833 RepID=A0A667Z309_9TELE|nr:caveolae-associated protein 2-like [Myripristis murdjan]